MLFKLGRRPDRRPVGGLVAVRDFRQIHVRTQDRANAVIHGRDKAGATMPHAGVVDVDDGGRQIHILKPKPRAFGQQLATRGDQCFAVIDDPPGLVADQVGVDIRRPERPRGVADDLLAHAVFAERKMAGTRVEDNIDALRRQLWTRAARDPGVLADLKADPHTIDLEQLIAQQVRLAVVAPFDMLARRPRLEPSRFVMNAIARQKPLGDQTQDFPVGQHRRRIEQAPTVHDRQADRHRQAFGLGQQRLQDPPRLDRGAPALKRILAAIPGNAQLGQTNDPHLVGAGHSQALNNALVIALPIQRGLVDRSSGDFDEFHGLRPSCGQVW